MTTKYHISSSIREEQAPFSSRKNVKKHKVDIQGMGIRLIPQSAIILKMNKNKDNTNANVELVFQ